MTVEVTPAETVLVHRTERSVLDGPGAAQLQPFAVFGRKRLATCSGVSWFRGYHLAVANLYGGHVRIYRFDPPAASLELLHELHDGIAFPEDAAVSPDGRLLAVTHSLSDGARLSAHAIDPRTLQPQDGGVTVRPGRTFHGIRFSPDSRHLAVTDIGAPGYLEVMRAGSWETTTRRENTQGRLKPKCAAFSADGRYLAVASAPNASTDAREDPGWGALAVYPFDAATGVPAHEPLGLLEAPLRNPEMCAFLPGRRYRVLVTDQAEDVVFEVDVDAAAGQLRLAGTFADGLSFPHGIDASADGRYVATTSYGDDTLRVSKIVS